MAPQALMSSLKFMFVFHLIFGIVSVCGVATFPLASRPLPGVDSPPAFIASCPASNILYYNVWDTIYFYNLTSNSTSINSWSKALAWCHCFRVWRSKRYQKTHSLSFHLSIASSSIFDAPSGQFISYMAPSCTSNGILYFAHSDVALDPTIIPTIYNLKSITRRASVTAPVTSPTVTDTSAYSISVDIPSRTTSPYVSPKAPNPEIAPPLADFSLSLTVPL